MKKMILAAAVLLVALCATDAARAQEIKTFQYENAIQVNGRAERKITPDEIWVSITLRDNEPKGRTVEALEADMKRGFAALGIDVAAALRVTSMANAPRKRNQVDTSRSYELKVGDVARLGQVFEVLGEMGVTQAGVSRLSHSRIEELRSEVRTEAVQNARKIADELAEALDQKIGRAVWIIDNGFYESSPVPMYRTRAVADAMFMSAAGAETVDAELEMQQVTLTYNVTVKFAL